MYIACYFPPRSNKERDHVRTLTQAERPWAEFFTVTSVTQHHSSNGIQAYSSFSRRVELSGNCRRTLIPSRQQLMIHLPIEELMQNNAVKTNVERILIVKKAGEKRKQRAVVSGGKQIRSRAGRRGCQNAGGKKRFPFTSCQFW